VLGGVLALLCVGGVGLGLVLYNEETKPDRSAPDVVVSNYLRALLVERDEARARVFECSRGASLDSIRLLRDEIGDREAQHAISIRVTWGSLAVQEGGERALVTTEIRRTVSDGSERDVQRWQFVAINDGGWRVCGAERVS
jgi:hypothetical protein